jgi:L-rhamnonate dehydratase
MAARCAAASIRRVAATAYQIPTDKPEADGTFRWNATTLVVVQVEAGDCTGAIPIPMHRSSR